MRRLIAAAGAFLAAIAIIPLNAQEIRDVDVTVRLQKDGSAHVTQVWDATVVAGTEWYIPVNNLGKMEIVDFSVSENGELYASDGRHWDSDRSRSAKAFRSGIIEKGSDGVELCWGQGEYGPHVWTASFTILNLVQSLQDYDAFNYQFINDELVAAPQHAKVTIINETGSEPWTEENSGIWAFGYNGNILFQDGDIVAESTEPFQSKSSMIVMCRFEKGLFSPAVSRDIPFEKMQKKAFKGSSYKEKKGFEDYLADITAWGMVGIILLCIFGIPLLIIAYLLWLLWVKVSGRRWKPSVFGDSKPQGWYREPPMNGDIAAAFSALSEGDRLSKKHNAELIGALFLKWLQDGFIKVVPDPKNDSRVDLAFDPSDTLDVGESYENDLYNMALEAAGDNHILEAGEFEKWAKRKWRKISAWPDKVKTIGEVAWKRQTVEERENLIKFKNFLEEFTMVSDRDAIEVKLWKSYMVYAQLFGIADRVAKNFQKLYPADFEKYVQGMGLTNYTMFTNVLSNTNRSASAMLNKAYEAKSASSSSGGSGWSSRGGGGFSSFGGGGGFSGGGHGGGSR
ncbi:MAG: DUF2207 domain-containing protein [Bacteroidales bacterium]|nr:DUF2207 domain-containing protein [Bacteroidales bacterium]